MPDKLLTVIVPSYNMEEYLPKCLGSLIVPDEAMLQRLDVIVVNDGSKDRTSEIAHQFEKDYPGVFRVIDKENGHYGSCINAALPVADGTFVKVLDADDSVDLNGFETMLEAIHSIVSNCENEVDVVISNAVKTDEGGAFWRYSTWFDHGKSCFDLSELTYQDISNLWMHQVTYRTSMLIDIGYRQSERIPYTDQEWMFSPMAKVRRASIIPVVVYKYLVGRDGQTIDEVFYIRHFSIIRNLTLKHIDEYLRFLPFATKGGKRYLEQRLISRISLVCRRHLLVSRDILANEEQDFIVFCNTVDTRVPELFMKVVQIRLLRRIPIGYVDAWRRKIAGHPFRYWLLFDLFLPLAKVRARFPARFHF